MNKILSKIALLSFFVFLVACQSQKTPEDQSKESPKYAKLEMKNVKNSTASKASTTAKEVNFEENAIVYFDFDKSQLKSSEKDKLANQAIWLKNNKYKNITVEGHTDYLGTQEYNLALGERRANSSKSFLVKQGVDSKKIKSLSFGKEQPVNNAQTDEARAENRRTVTVVSK